MNNTQKLAFISEVMSDAYYFVQMRSLMEQIENDAERATAMRDGSAEKILDIMDKFYNLCVYVKRHC